MDKPAIDLGVFLQPRSVAVIGASDKPGSWGSFMMGGLAAWRYPGTIYPVNRRAGTVSGHPAFPDVRDIPGEVDLAVMAVPEAFVEETIRACGEKGVRGMSIITAGFGEAVRGGRERELAFARLAHGYGMRLLGPNISGTFNLHAGFNAAASPAEHLYPTKLAAVCQGGFAFYDLLAAGSFRKMGVGRFVHTGNECDLTVTDFLEYFGADPEVPAILTYLETIRDGERFLEVARRVTRMKPVIAFKAGRSAGAARAAQSHTGALAGRAEVFAGFLRQAGVITVPTMDVMLPLAHALVEHPPLKGPRIGIVTIGGSWGVALADALEEEGLCVPELSAGLQERLRALDMPPRASTRNPIDLGAAGMVSLSDRRQTLGRVLLESGEVDALVVHGLGRPGRITETRSEDWKAFQRFEKWTIRQFVDLERETGLPVLVGAHFAPWESQVVWDLNEKGIRIHNRLDEIARVLAGLLQDGRRGPGG